MVENHPNRQFFKNGSKPLKELLVNRLKILSSAIKVGKYATGIIDVDSSIPFVLLIAGPSMVADVDLQIWFRRYFRAAMTELRHRVGPLKLSMTRLANSPLRVSNGDGGIGRWRSDATADRSAERQMNFDRKLHETVGAGQIVDSRTFIASLLSRQRTLYCIVTEAMYSYFPSHFATRISFFYRSFDDSRRAHRWGDRLQDDLKRNLKRGNKKCWLIHESGRVWVKKHVRRKARGGGGRGEM